MFKRLLTMLLLAVLMVQTISASAADLDSAFNSLFGGGAVGTTDKPGVYSTPMRTNFVAGGVDVRFPRAQNVSLMSITPPSLSATGCGGISAHFGGFSFVSGKQIEQLIKNIGQNAMGMVVSVTIKTLCPICDAVIQAMTKLAQDAARMSVNSCQMAESLVSGLMSTTGKGGAVATQGMCTGNVTAKGSSSDYLEAAQGVDAVCSDISKAMNKVSESLSPQKKADGTTAPGDIALANENKKKLFYGNLTWITLGQIYGDPANLIQGTADGDEEIRNRTLLLNILGGKIITAKSDNKLVADADDLDVNILETMGSKELFELFMCGAPTSYNEAGAPVNGAYLNTVATNQYCSKFYNSAKDSAGNAQGRSGGFGYVVWECPQNDIANCLKPQRVALQNSTMLKGAGFLPQTEALLLEAVETVRSNNDRGFNPKFVNMVNQVNFPIYQAVNAAAVYPAAAADLVSTMAVLTAESLVVAKLDEILRPHGRNAEMVPLEEDTARRIYTVLDNMQKNYQDQRLNFGRMLAVQEGAMQAIRQVNLAIQKQVLTPELLGNQKYGSAVANSVTQKPAD